MARTEDKTVQKFRLQMKPEIGVPLAARQPVPALIKGRATSGGIRRSWSVLGGLALMVFCIVAAQTAAASPPRFATGVVPVENGRRAALATLARLPDGRMLSCYSRLRGDIPDFDSIWCVSTADLGRTWSAPVKVIERPGPGYITDPVILVLGEQITVLATYVVAPYPPFSRSENWGITSTDGGRTWADPFQIKMPHRYCSGKIHPPLVLDDGTLLIGYGWDMHAEQGKAVNTEPEMQARAGLLRSTDGGRTWTAGADIVVDQPMGADEPGSVLLKDGSVLVVVRTGGPRPFEVRTRDQGRTWEQLRPSQFVGHNTPTALHRLADGSILRVWDRSAKNRYPLVAAVSRDECRTWSTPRVITDQIRGRDGKVNLKTACYPAIAQDDDGTIFITWWETGEFGTRIAWARFAADWPERG